MAAAPGRDVAVVTPWLPTRVRPAMGAFVQSMLDATVPGCDSMDVYHCDEWPIDVGEEDRGRIDGALHELIPRARHWRPAGERVRRLHLPVPLTFQLGYDEIARRHAAVVRTALDGRPLPQSVVHAHVGLPSGWAAMVNARPDARIFVTEHASYLDKLLDQPGSRAMYDELLHRCSGLFAVGEAVRRPLVAAFPHHADRITIVPNAVSFADRRTEPVTQLHRWLYAGRLIPAKGVTTLLEAFAQCHAENGRLTLTFAGDGPLLKTLKERTAELGLTGAVTYAGMLRHDEALALMRRHDLLVHPSHFETFGMVVVEAAAAGLPVLVTRCGGPEESLAGIESDAGELVAIEDAPDALVEGYRRLRDRFPHGMDLAKARATLADRYSYDAVAQAHARAWFPATPALDAVVTA